MRTVLSKGPVKCVISSTDFATAQILPGKVPFTIHTRKVFGPYFNFAHSLQTNTQLRHKNKPTNYLLSPSSPTHYLTRAYIDTLQSKIHLHALYYCYSYHRCSNGTVLNIKVI